MNRKCWKNAPKGEPSRPPAGSKLKQPSNREIPRFWSEKVTFSDSPLRSRWGRENDYFQAPFRMLFEAFLEHLGVARKVCRKCSKSDPKGTQARLPEGGKSGPLFGAKVAPGWAPGPAKNPTANSFWSSSPSLRNPRFSLQNPRFSLENEGGRDRVRFFMDHQTWVALVVQFWSHFGPKWCPNGPRMAPEMASK